MNIQQFQYVLAVVDSKNFELAAERCHVTQSTLSTMIGRFEDELGVKLFNRKTKRNKTKTFLRKRNRNRKTRQIRFKNFKHNFGKCKTKLGRNRN